MQLPIVLLALLGLLSPCGAIAPSGLRASSLRTGATGALHAADVHAAVEAQPVHLALLETSMREAGINSTDLGLPSEPSVDDLQTVLATLVADRKAGKVTPGMENFIKVVTGMIKNDMMPKLMKQHRDAKATLKRFELGFRTCGKIRSVSKASISSLALTKKSTTTNHLSCRKVEDTKFKAKKACQAIVAEKLKAKRVACNAYKALLKDPSSEANNCHTTNSAEPYGLWLKRNRKDFGAKLTAYKAAKARCQAATRAHRRVQKPCIIKTNSWKSTKASCTVKQYKLETSTCTLAKKMKDTCTTYTGCYDQQVKLYKKQKPKLKVQEKDRKGEYRALKRIDCLLTRVFGDSTVDEKKIDECTKITWSTKHLDLKYPPIPAKKKCPQLPPVPGTKVYKKKEYSQLPMNTNNAPMLTCNLNPGGGVIMGLDKNARKDKCFIENGWLKAQYGGSCLVSGVDGIPVTVDYTKRRYTRYTFQIKMDETNPRNGRSEGGGFEICNKKNKLSFVRGSDQKIQFTDSRNNWGYHLSGFQGVSRSRRTATCNDLFVKYNVWGRTAQGMDFSKYTSGKLKWIGCMGDGCSASSFYCKQSRDMMEFGSPGTLRGLVGTKDGKVPQKYNGCCSKKNPHSICNAMDKTHDINILCRQLGYTRGTILASRRTNWCPEVSYDKKNGWGSDYVNSHGYGNKFRCQGVQAPRLYTNKKYYKASEPKAGLAKNWDLTMEYKGGKYMIRSLKIEGVSFSGYKGAITSCPTRSVNYGFAPRIGAFGTGKVWIKDVKVFQGNSMKKMKQVVGQGLGEHAEMQKKLLMKAALRAVQNMAMCTSQPWTRTWQMRHMVRSGTVFKKNHRVGNGWNSWAILSNVASVKFRILYTSYQHIRVGLTPGTKADLHFRNGAHVSMWPPVGQKRMYFWPQGGNRVYRKGDTLTLTIEGRRICTRHNNWKKCTSPLKYLKNGMANLQIWMYEGHQRQKRHLPYGIKVESVCTKKR